MTKSNPYSLVFGKEPQQVIPRIAQTDELIQWFEGDPPSQQICMITGVRGSGKTVQMTMVGRHFASLQDWIVTELNSDGDILKSLAAKLASHRTLAKLFQSAKINLSFFGIGLEVSGSVPVTDLETALTEMLTVIKRKGKKILITIDEVTVTPQMKVFTNAFQIFLRQDLPVYLIMTGLYENIYELQNQKSLTFLYRAPKIQLEPLNIGTMTDNYEKTLGISREEALAMAKMTKGYSFAFQVLGYFTWQNGNDKAKTRISFKQYLQEYVYSKIWSEMSHGDKKLAEAIAHSESGKVEEIRSLLGMDSHEFAPYRQRLIRKGIVNGLDRGYLRFTLPLFDEFVEEQTDI